METTYDVYWVEMSRRSKSIASMVVRHVDLYTFKRACFNWGIGRELYTSPFIWIPADKCNINNGKCHDKFKVEKIQIENKVITGLAIYNETKKERAFVWVKQ